jgi:hypothetical protein
MTQENGTNFNPNRDDDGKFATGPQMEPTGNLYAHRELTDREVRMDAARDAMFEARRGYNEAAKAVVAEVILDKFPTAAKITVNYNWLDNDEDWTYISSISEKSYTPDQPGNVLWEQDHESDIEDSPFARANDLLSAFGPGIRSIDLTPYRELPVELLVLKIKLAGYDEKERLVDDATDEQRQILAEDTDADIRYLVARSPKTDMDTLRILMFDSEDDVAAAALGIN